MHGNAVRVCLCDYEFTARTPHNTVHTIELNWQHRPRFFLLCAANYIVQGENKWHVHFLLSSSSLAVTAAAVPVASITIAATTATPTTALAAQSAASTATCLCLLPDLQYKTYSKPFFVSVCLMIRSFEYRWFYFTVCFTHDRFEKSFIVWSELQQCSHSFNNTSSEFDGNFWSFLCISSLWWKGFEEKPVAASSSKKNSTLFDLKLFQNFSKLIDMQNCANEIHFRLCSISFVFEINS